MCRVSRQLSQLFRGTSGFEYQNSDWVVALDPTTFAINVAAGGPHYVWVRVSDALGKTALARIGDIVRLSLSFDDLGY
jgi:hypothetical protein